MRKATRRKIAIRAAEAGDYQALARLYADRNAYAQTLQLPFPNPELWRKRLAQNDETQHTLVATVAGDIVGNLGLMRLTRARRAHVGELGMGVRDA
jgi:putative acetyltransferase